MTNKKNLLGILLISILALPLCVACSSDDEEKDLTNYTTNDVVQLLRGKWDIKGNCSYTLKYLGVDSTVTDNVYTGQIEFFDDMKYQTKIQIKKNNNYTLEDFIGNSGKYTVLRTTNNIYLSFPEIDMKVLYLNRKAFKFEYESNDCHFDDKRYLKFLHLTVESD